MRVPHTSRTLRCVGLVTLRTASGSPSHSKPLDYADSRSKSPYRNYGAHHPHFITTRVKPEEWSWRSSTVRSRAVPKSRTQSFAKCANDWGTLIVLATRLQNQQDRKSVV